MRIIHKIHDSWLPDLTPPDLQPVIAYFMHYLVSCISPTDTVLTYTWYYSLLSPVPPIIHSGVPLSPLHSAELLLAPGPRTRAENDLPVFTITEKALVGPSPG